ncbi:MAG: hypothetical protein HY869_07665 [Chloroflexi bacterium]|nr:hypothetical protein [Chloroflexota bacterium]
MNDNSLPDPLTPSLLTPEQLNQLSDEISQNSIQITINQEIAAQSADLWVEQKANLFIQTLTKVDESFDLVIVSILGSITNDLKR